MTDTDKFQEIKARQKPRLFHAQNAISSLKYITADEIFNAFRSKK